jgi:hypothetical protein
MMMMMMMMAPNDSLKKKNVDNGAWWPKQSWHVVVDG